MEARRYDEYKRDDWLDVRIGMMDKVLQLKFTQHQTLLEELLATGEAELVEDSDRDSFWGIGADRNGQNQLGKALMRLRATLRDPTPPEPSRCFLHRNGPQKMQRSPPPSGTLVSPDEPTKRKWLNSNNKSGPPSMCEYCGSAPKHGNYAYCSHACGRHAKSTHKQGTTQAQSPSSSRYRSLVAPFTGLTTFSSCTVRH